ncbi:gliding motility-associated C-terminal domain-containing protein [Carboxylicivirga caseinilyticus]|uniref:T9SS type B sorting domain-containing protein n=1 Tax=Carboxylicivirga caseinilyticus TaxID=3417572 RepID=UPI003D342FF6|nr:gliding motility-associated C-terminal domain-containing protein [Marinilabiliaceae bacterium A049]
MKLKILWTFLALWGLSYISLFAQPTATIVSLDADSCEIGKAELKILFEGEAPFGVVYRIDNKETGGSSYQIELDKNIFDNNLVDGVWTTTTINISDTSEITLIEVFDNTINAADWKYSLGDNGYGSLDVNGKMTLNINKMPTPIADNFTPQCGYVAPLNATLSDPDHIIYWTEESGAGSFSGGNNTIPNAIFIADSKGLYTLTLTEENGACKATDVIEVDLWGSPNATISGNQIICSNDGTNYSLNVTTEITNGTSPYRYTISNGSLQQTRTGITFADNISIQATEETSWSLIEVVDQRGCEAHVDSLHGEATVVDKKPNPFAGLADDWCQLEGYELQASLEEGETGAWQVHPNVSFVNNNDPKTLASSTVYGAQTLTWLADNGGCSDVATVDITFVEPPTLNLLSPDTAICAGNNALLRTATTSEYYDLVLTYTDGAQTLTANINSINTETFLEPSETTAYQLTAITDNKGCSTELSETFNVVVDYIPELMTGTYDTICGNWTPLNAEILENTTSGHWSSEDGTFSDLSSPTSDFTFNQTAVIDSASVQWLVVNEENLYCRDSAVFKLYFTKEPENVSAGSDTTIYLVDHVVLKPEDWEDGMTVWWESSDPNVIIQFSDDSTYTAFGIPPGTSYLTWTVKSSDDCYISDEITITQNPLTAPNGFSPDGDGINDYFKIGGAENLSNKKLAVFNKKGMLIYDTENLGDYNTGSDIVIWWDGKDNDGNILPADTYYYTFTGDYNGQVFTKKDFVVIKY